MSTLSRPRCLLIIFIIYFVGANVNGQVEIPHNREHIKDSLDIQPSGSEFYPAEDVTVFKQMNITTLASSIITEIKDVNSKEELPSKGPIVSEEVIIKLRSSTDAKNITSKNATTITSEAGTGISNENNTSLNPSSMSPPNFENNSQIIDGQFSSTITSSVFNEKNDTELLSSFDEVFNTSMKSPVNTRGAINTINIQVTPTMAPVNKMNGVGSQKTNTATENDDFDDDGVDHDNDGKEVPHREDEGGTYKPGSNPQYKLSVKTEIINLHASESDMGCDGRRGSLVPIAKKSKFFVDPTFIYDYEGAKQLCRRNKLVMAEVDSLSHQFTLQRYIYGQLSQPHLPGASKKYYIGANDIKMEGAYVRAEDGFRIKYQSYHPSQPDNYNPIENCTALGQMGSGGPVGMSDEDCSKRFFTLCMFDKGSDCLKDTIEEKAFAKSFKARTLKSILNYTDKFYFVSNFQLPWRDALNYCGNQSMTLFDMDNIVSPTFFKLLVKFEENLINKNAPNLRYWTAGRFKGSHMTAPVFWHQESKHAVHESETARRNFTFSGVFLWSDVRQVNDSAVLEYGRKDLCLSFSFDLKPDDLPYVINNNCELPAYFICRKEEFIPIDYKTSD